MSGTRMADLDEHGSIDAPPGSRAWAIAVRREIYSALHDRKSASQNLRAYVDLFREHKGYLQLSDRRGRPFATHEAFCVAPYPFGLGYRPEDIDQIIVERKDREVSDRAANPLTLLEHGRPPKGEQEDKGSNGTLKRGNPADYLTARIARDHPEILNRMKAGEFRSVRQAALEAGIVRPTITLPLAPLAAVRLIAKYFKDDALEALLRGLADWAGYELTPKS